MNNTTETQIVNSLGRVSDWTIGNFFINMWTNAAIATAILLSFLAYRHCRGD